MKKPLDKNSVVGRGSIRADEILTLREFGRRLGLASRALCDAQRQGLRTIVCGRVKYILGKDALSFFERLAEAQSGEGSAE